MQSQQSHPLRNLTRTILYVAPLILGVIGFSVIGQENLSDGLFQSVLFYFLNNTDTPSNIFIEIARWTAPLMTASWVLTALDKVRLAIRNRLVYLFRNSVAVYGNGEEAEYLLDQLGGSGIRGENYFLKADRYIFAGEENENFALYERMKNQIGKKPVYLKSRNLEYRKTDGNLVLFYPEETAARLYWKERNLYALAKEKNFQLKVAILGFNELGENLLRYGLTDNLFHPQQRIEYHIYGNSKEFRDLYHEISQIQDPVIFHDEAWHTDLEFLQTADRIIVLDDAQLLQKLCFSIPNVKADILLSQNANVETFVYADNVTIFNWKEKALAVGNIFRETLLENAKRINMRYEYNYSGGKLKESKKTMEQLWDKLSPFLKYSNISSADYHEIQRKMVEIDGLTPEKLTLPENQDYLARLAELEHHRWNRYHYLNNWKFGAGPDGKKNERERIHPLLIPYRGLDNENRRKDMSNLMTLFNLKL